MKEEDMIKELKKFKKDDLVDIVVAAICALVPGNEQEGFLKTMMEIVEGKKK